MSGEHESEGTADRSGECDRSLAGELRAWFEQEFGRSDRWAEPDFYMILNLEERPAGRLAILDRHVHVGGTIVQSWRNRRSGDQTQVSSPRSRERATRSCGGFHEKRPSRRVRITALPTRGLARLREARMDSGSWSNFVLARAGYGYVSERHDGPAAYTQRVAARFD